MKKTVLSVATLTAITGVAATTVSADEYTISSGDTLWGIASEVGTSVSDLKTDNKLSSDIIFPGDVLTFDVEVPEETTNDNEQSPHYIVKPGDTLSQIGAEYSVDYNEIMKWNNLSSDLIYVGQEIAIEEVAPVEAAVAPVVETVEVQEVEPAAEVVEEPVVEEVAEVQEVEPAAEVVEEPVVEEVAEVQEVEPAAEVVEEPVEVQEAVVEEPTAEEVAVAEQEAAAEEAQVVAEQEAAEEAQAVAEQEAAEEAQAVAEREAAEEAQAAEQAAAEQAATERAAEQAAAEEKAEQETPAASTPVSSASNGTNHYSWGTCAWYVFEKRSDMGLSVGNGWGDAKSWASNAQSAGYSVGNSPSVGAIMQAPAYTNGAYGQGHVAIVERVNGDGSILVSEMQFGGSIGEKNTRTISASQVSNHNFIN